ncbi:MAG: hypothetical protein Unbinned5350contig1001_39 [Prokaryotic dsDNA virus sp.]|nr:MAG: hypothetical protein Unbinned5350contig1001_39 [Prokaryotic dsDNA virus sp.]|tara:strand:- start:12986 stop:13189 length:204 start_codon:yes stop_codon:yes gene_type:complete
MELPNAEKYLILMMGMCFLANVLFFASLLDLTFVGDLIWGSGAMCSLFAIVFLVLFIRENKTFSKKV